MHDYSQHNIQFDLHHAATTGNVGKKTHIHSTFVSRHIHLLLLFFSIALQGLVKFALDHGATTDAIVNGLMPLQLACVSDNNLAAVQYLIDRGAQVNAQRQVYIFIFTL